MHVGLAVVRRRMHGLTEATEGDLQCVMHRGTNSFST